MNALLVGGPADVRKDLARKLRPHGIEIVEHREYHRNGSRPLPEGIDLVLFLTDMSDHPTFWTTREMARAKAVKFVPIKRKWSHATEAMKLHGLIAT